MYHATLPPRKPPAVPRAVIQAPKGGSGITSPKSRRKRPSVPTTRPAPCPHCGGFRFYDGDDWPRCLQCGRETPPPGYTIRTKQDDRPANRYRDDVPEWLQGTPNG